MLMKSHRSGNLCNGIWCGSGLWTGLQRCNSRGIISAFLWAPHPSSQCRAHLSCEAKPKWSEPFGSSLVPSSAVELFLLLTVLVALGGHMPRPFSPRQDVSGAQRSISGEVPGMGWWPEMLIHLWAQHMLLWTSPWPLVAQADQHWCSWLCARQLSFGSNLSAWETSRNTVLCLSL